MAPTKTHGAPRGTAQGNISNSLITLTTRAVPLPPIILQFILDNASVIRRLEKRAEKRPGDHAGEAQEDLDIEAEQEQEAEEELGVDDIVRKPTVKLERFWDGLKEKCVEAGGEWAGIVEDVWCFGPRTAGCLLIDARKGGLRRS